MRFCVMVATPLGSLTQLQVYKSRCWPCDVIGMASITRSDRLCRPYPTPPPPPPTPPCNYILLLVLDKWSCLSSIHNTLRSGCCYDGPEVQLSREGPSHPLVNKRIIVFKVSFFPKKTLGRGGGAYLKTM